MEASVFCGRCNEVTPHTIETHSAPLLQCATIEELRAAGTGEVLARCTALRRHHTAEALAAAADLSRHPLTGDVVFSDEHFEQEPRECGHTQKFPIADLQWHIDRHNASNHPRVLTQHIHDALARQEAALGS